MRVHIDQPIASMPLLRIAGACNAYALVHQNRAILFDCHKECAGTFPAHVGIDEVCAIYLTSWDRLCIEGLKNWKSVPIYATEGVCSVLENADELWKNDQGMRYHMTEFVPSAFIPADRIKTSGVIEKSTCFYWGDVLVRVWPTPGFSKDDTAYILQNEHVCVAIIGRMLQRGGRLDMLHLLQKPCEKMCSGYHGFLESLDDWIDSIEGLSKQASYFCPSYGEMIDDVQADVQRACQIARDTMNTYVQTSALHHYFPSYMHKKSPNTEPLIRAKVTNPPAYVQRIGQTTSFMVRSKTGAFFLVDCSDEAVIDMIFHIKRESGRVPDFCYVTHYHHDHVQKLAVLAKEFGVPVYADPSVGDILRNPSAYLLTCLAPTVVCTEDKLDGHTEKWHEYVLDFYHFPGQTLYHGAMALIGRNRKILFVGDSFSPTGLDDYCAWNRNFIGHGQGYLYCLDLLNKIRPDFLINQHQTQAFAYETWQIERLAEGLLRRQRLLCELVSSNVNEAFDPLFVRCRPYGQSALPQSCIKIRVYVTGHRSYAYPATIEMKNPVHWTSTGKQSLVVHPSNGLDAQDAYVTFSIDVPKNATGRFVVEFRFTAESVKKALTCHAIVDIIKENNGTRIGKDHF